MRVEETRQTIVPGLEMLFDWNVTDRSSALISIGYGDKLPENSGGCFALKVFITENCLLTILNGAPDAANLVLGCAADDGAIRIPVHLPETVRSIDRIVRGYTYKEASLTLILQGKVLQLLAAGMAASPSLHKEAMEARIAKSVVDILLIDPLNPPTLPALSARVGEPQRKLIDIFRAHYGKTIAEWLADWQFNYARDQLLKRSMSLREISEVLGYGSVSNFSAAFSKRFGVSPGRLRKEFALSKNTAATATSCPDKGLDIPGVRRASALFN